MSRERGILPPAGQEPRAEREEDAGNGGHAVNVAHEEQNREARNC
jgi:hypothetical protein